MKPTTRRQFVRAASAVAGGSLLTTAPAAAAPSGQGRAIKVVVWDERQPAQTKAYRGDGKPSFVKVLRPEHPIVEGVPPEFEIPQTEMYDEPFHVPPPDEVILEERWASGEWFRSGAVWKLGQGKVFYFRPGHETYPVYKQAIPLRIVTNAVRWLGGVSG